MLLIAGEKNLRVAIRCICIFLLVFLVVCPCGVRGSEDSMPEVVPRALDSASLQGEKSMVKIEYISITPVFINIHMGQKRTFRATALWSDGHRTDLTGSPDGRWLVSDSSVGRFLPNTSVFLAEKIGKTEIRMIMGDKVSNVAQVTVEEGISQPVLAVSPREIDLGVVGPEESSEAFFYLKNLGSGAVNWYVDAPSGWSLKEGHRLSGAIGNKSDHIRVCFRSLKKDNRVPEVLYPAQLTLESRGRSVIYVKNLTAGVQMEMIKLVSDGGTRRVFVRFEVAQQKSAPLIEVAPLGIDAGIVYPDKPLLKRIQLKNGGRGALRWKARLWRGDKTTVGMPLKKGRYVSFLNEEINERMHYAVPDRLKDSVDISGEWYGNGGYPCSCSMNAVLRYRFTGNGAAVFIRKDFDGGKLLAYIDGKPTKEIDCYSEKKERLDLQVVEGLEEKEHVLELVNRQGCVVVEGVRVYSETIVMGRSDWMKISPRTGTIVRETDYVNIMINPRRMKPGYYCNNIRFTSNGGAEVVEVSFQVPKDGASRILDIYSYVKGTDRLYTADPESEDKDFLEGYRKQCVAFRLFSKNTPGTTPFFRWYNPSRGAHFYSYEKDGGGISLKDYIFEGSIGNIATTKLPETKELYRWLNFSSGVYFYTTDPKGEGSLKRGYKYDGIAGYVR